MLHIWAGNPGLSSFSDKLNFQLWYLLSVTNRPHASRIAGGAEGDIADSPQIDTLSHSFVMFYLSIIIHCYRKVVITMFNVIDLLVFSTESWGGSPEKVNHNLAQCFDVLFVAILGTHDTLSQPRMMSASYATPSALVNICKPTVSTFPVGSFVFCSLPFSVLLLFCRGTDSGRAPPTIPRFACYLYTFFVLLRSYYLLYYHQRGLITHDKTYPSTNDHYFLRPASVFY